MKSGFDSRCLFLLLCAVLVSCAPLKDYNPRSPSTWDMLTRTRELDRYLANRRQVLSELRGQIGAIDERLDGELARLNEKRRMLALAEARTAQTATERSQMEANLAAQEQKANRVVRRLTELKGEVATLDERNRVVAEEADREFARVQQMKQRDIPSIERDIESLQSGVNSGLRRSQDELTNR